MVKFTFGKESLFPQVPYGVSEKLKEKQRNENKVLDFSSRAISLPYKDFMNLTLKELADITGEKEIYIAREARGVNGEAYLLRKSNLDFTETIRETLNHNLINPNGFESIAIISKANNVETLIGIYSNKETILPGNLNSQKLGNYVQPTPFNNIESIDEMTTQYNSKIPITMFNNNYSNLNQKIQ